MRRLSVAMAFSLAVASAANADPLNITNITGGWDNAVPAVVATINNAAGQGTDTIRWPANETNQSGYNFTPANDILNAALSTPLLLGTFQHINLPISAAITSVSYDFAFATNGTPNALSDTFLFTHDETPNAPGPPASDDHVLVSSVSLNQLINVNGEFYFFNLLGFSTDGGVTFSNSFTSP